MEFCERKYNVLFQIIVSAYICAMCISRWNAVYSITYGLALAMMVVWIYARRKEICVPDKIFNFVYWPFFICLFLSSAILGDYPSIISSWNFFYWATPFILLYFLCQHRLPEKYIIIAMAVALWIISGSAVMQYVMAGEKIRVTGIFGGANDLADMLCMNMAFLSILTWSFRHGLYTREKYLAYGACYIALIALMLTG